MKKFLSMVLALVMAMSLVTISAGAADFTDKDSIDYLEAVEVMTAIGVVDGYTDGSFGPNGYLTRGAAAKIICNLILGPTTAEALVADAAPYSDVPTSNVFAGYIAFCQKEGIISGYADGTFRPGNSLTGYAFMKMLLGALGYDAEIEGYTGNNWSINVAKKAINLGLEDGLEGDFNGVNTVTRQEALLYAFNAIQCKMVEYPNNTSIKVGDVEVTTTSSAQEQNTFCSEYFPKLSSDDTVTDAYGRPATKWTNDKTTIGTYADKADATYYYAAKTYQIRKDLDVTAGTTPTFALVYNGVGSYSGTATMPLATSNDGKYNYAWMTGDVDGDGNYEYVAPGRGITVEYFYDKDNAANNKVVMIDQMIGKVTNVKTDDDGRYVTVAGYRYYTEEFAKNDWVIYTVAHFGDEVEIGSMALAEKITGTVTWLTDTASDGKYFFTYIDGVAYYNHGYAYLPFGIGDEVNVWLDANGYIIKSQVTEAATALEKLVMIDKNSDSANLAGNYQGSVIYGDGTNEIVTLYAEYEENLGKIYSYTMSNGKLKLVEHQDYETVSGTAGLEYDKGDTTLGGIKVNSNTGFVYINNADGTIKNYVGYKNAPSIKEWDGTVGSTKVTALVKKDTQIATVVYVWVNAGSTYSTSSDITWVVTDFAYSYNTTNADGEEYTYHTLKTLDGMTVNVTPAVYSAIYSKYYVGAIALDDLTYDENGCISGYSDVTDYAVYMNGNYNTTYYFDVKVENDVLYIDESVAVWSAHKALAYADDAVAYIVAYNGDTYYEEDITAIEGTYTGVSYMLNEAGEVETLVLKELNPDA